MVERVVTITNETGLHARPASQFIAFVNKYKECDITLLKDEKKANAKSILNILTLGLNKDSNVTVRVEGENEEAALDEIVSFISNLKD